MITTYIIRWSFTTPGTWLSSSTARRRWRRCWPSSTATWRGCRYTCCCSCWWCFHRELSERFPMWCRIVRAENNPYSGPDVSSFQLRRRYVKYFMALFHYLLLTLPAHRILMRLLFGFLLLSTWNSIRILIGFSSESNFTPGYITSASNRCCNIPYQRDLICRD